MKLGAHIAILIVLSISTSAFSFRNSFSRHQVSRCYARIGGDIGGKILVTGIGSFEEDEFFLTLLKEQDVWTSICLASEDSVAAKKKFLSRTARYSGLLNVLEFVDANLDNSDQLANAINGANAWLAFNVSQSVIPSYADMAVSAGIKRAIFTTELAPERINDTNIPAFDHAVTAFESAGGAFTGIRHGRVIPGDENFPYEIVNSSLPLFEDTVERGVLARVVAELTLIPDSSNKLCGVCSSGVFSRKYLELLRGTGLNRREEVSKVFNGGIQKLAYIALSNMRDNQQANKDRQDALAKEKAEMEEEERKMKASAELREAVKARQEELGDTMGEMDLFPKETVDQRIERRTLEILQEVWREYDVRMYTRSTSKKEFFDMNREKAVLLANQELAEEKEKKRVELEDKRSRGVLLDKFVDMNRRQMAKLQALERKEIQSQKEMSDVWVKYVYLLIEYTLEKCLADGVLFHNLDEYAQTLLLRERANALRTLCGLPEYAVIYDPLDAAVVVNKLQGEPLGVKLGLNSEDTETVVVALESKYGHLLKSITALRGASQILELAIETLQRELPPPPPSVQELRSAETSAKQAAVAKMKLAALRNRNQPKAPSESIVGRM